MEALQDSSSGNPSGHAGWDMGQCHDPDGWMP